MTRPAGGVARRLVATALAGLTPLAALSACGSADRGRAGAPAGSTPPLAAAAGTGVAEPDPSGPTGPTGATGPAGPGGEAGEVAAAAPDPAPEPEPDADPQARNGPGYLVAEARVERLAVWDRPAAEEPPRLELAHPTASGAPLVLLVTASTEGWLRVQLPVRPNGSEGWVRAADVAISGHRWRIDVHLGAHELVVRHGEEVWMVEPIAVGRQPTPTPGGTYYLFELLAPPEPSGPYGPFAFGLSGFSEVLDSFAGGDGRLGLHGTNEPATLGGDVTYGCIRVHNDAITQLASTLPLGTPITIHP